MCGDVHFHNLTFWGKKKKKKFSLSYVSCDLTRLPKVVWYFRPALIVNGKYDVQLFAWHAYRSYLSLLLPTVQVVQRFWCGYELRLCHRGEGHKDFLINFHHAWISITKISWYRHRIHSPVALFSAFNQFSTEFNNKLGLETRSDVL